MLNIVIVVHCLGSSHPDAAEKTSYQELRGFMKECRRKRYRQRPHTIEEFAQQLTEPEFGRNLEYDTGRFSVIPITDNNNGQHVVFYDAQFVHEEMSEVTRLFVDATFRARPRLEGAYQLLTVMGIKLNHVRF